MSRTPNATAGSLLGFLHAGPMSGWDLVEAAERVIGEFWSLTRSQVYRELARLAEDGLVEVGERGPRERRPYTLTDAGRTAFQDWIARDPGMEHIRYPLLLTLRFGQHLSEERLAAFVEAHRAAHEARLSHYLGLQDAAAKGAIRDGEAADPYAAATLDFGIRYETAVLEWIQALPETLNPPEPKRPAPRLRLVE